MLSFFPFIQSFCKSVQTPSYSQLPCKNLKIKIYKTVIVMEEGRSAFKILTGEPTGKRHLGRPMRRWGTILEISISIRNWD